MRKFRFVRRIFLIFITLSVLSFSLFYVVPPFLPEDFFDVSETPAPAQMIIMLGGDLRERVPKTIDLYEKGFAGHILISGADRRQTETLSDAIPTERLQVEDNAASTWENAILSRPLIEAMIRPGETVLLVTDSWHTRRSLACFRKACPQYRFIPVAADKISGPYFDPAQVKRREFAALLFYALRYQISP